MKKKNKPIEIHGYQSYGTNTHLYLLGRALAIKGVDLEKSRLWDVVKNAYKQFESDELINARLRITLPNNVLFYTTTDAEGYFKIDTKVEPLSKLTTTEGWLKVNVHFDDPDLSVSVRDTDTFSCEMLIPKHSAEYGIISDVDDTIMHTGVASFVKWRVLVNTLFKSFKQRVPLEGASELYQKLHRGLSGHAANPFFYVSNSPWNLYGYLQAFIKRSGFPRGAILLRDFRTPFDKTPLPEKPHKQKEIRNILNTYPDLKFVLVGDSGEHDVDIYLEIAQEYPDQILAVYLRSVKHKKKVTRVKGVLKNYGDIPAVLVRKSQFAEEHARKIGLIV